MKNMKTNMLNILVVEDELMLRNEILKLFEKPYSDILKLHPTNNVAEALMIMKTTQIDGIILDIVMPYGSDKLKFQRKSDPMGIDAGLWFLEKIRSDFTKMKHPIWIAVTTGRANPNLHQKLNHLIGGNGVIFYKPYCTIELEYKLCKYFKIDFRGMVELLQDDV